MFTFIVPLTQVCCLTLIWAVPVSQQRGRGAPGVERMEEEKGNREKWNMVEVVEEEDVGAEEIKRKIKRSPLPFRRLVIQMSSLIKAALREAFP